MCGVDQNIDMLGGEVRGQSHGPAEAADPYRHRVWHRGGGAARERQRDIEAAAPGEAFAEKPRFRGAAQNKDAWHG